MVSATARHKRRARKILSSDGTIPLQADAPLGVTLKTLLLSQNNKCNYCGVEISHALGNIQLDHIHPLSKGGAHSISNVQWLCAKCNGTKSNRILTPA